MILALQPGLRVDPRAGTALAHDGSHTIVFGCAGKIDLCKALGREVGAPVVD